MSISKTLKIFNKKDKKLENDFLTLKGSSSTHILNAISPAFTASFALADLIIDKNEEEDKEHNYGDIEKKIIHLLETKIRPAVARDGGDIKFKSFENGVVKVELQGACSGCPSSIMTLKQGVQNLLKHYVKEVNSVEAT